jgi:DNA-binding NarL/FixJ family response regulator
MLNSKIWTFKATFASWLMRSGVKPLIIYASDNKLILSLFFASTTRKKTVAGCFTSGHEVLDYLRAHEVGILISTLKLDDISGDELIAQARAIQPNLRTALAVDRSDVSLDVMRSWRSPVIVAAQDLGDISEPWRMAILSAIANTTYRSKSILQYQGDHQDPQIISLTPRDKDILQCFAMGLNNRETAERLQLSPHSTKTYSKRLLAKLNVNNRQRALLKVIGKGTPGYRDPIPPQEDFNQRTEIKDNT